MTLTMEVVMTAVKETAAAFRSVTDYEPAGGPGSQVYPATYEGGQCAEEERWLDGSPVKCVLLDSVQSQANRIELALLDAWERDRVPLPLVTVDFRDPALLKPFTVTSLEAPHRIVDALLRDSLLDGVPFRKSPLGRRLNTVEPRNATALFELCPTALLLGMWDSTGERGGMGAKFQRALVSEIVGLHAVQGKKTSSRIDPAQILLSAGPLYRAQDGAWTLDPAMAVRDRHGTPVKLGKDGKPSEANHGNVTPTIAAGGYTIAKARQTTVLSLAALRRLRFPLNGDSRSNPTVDDLARTVLAALGLCGATLAREQGADLRSRCQLFPVAASPWELLDAPGEPPKQYTLTADEAINLYRASVDAARTAGLPWLTEELTLTPSPDLLALVRKSQQLAAAQVPAAEA